MSASNDNFPVPHVVVAVCTCRRPLMLERCLESLAAQMVDGTMSLSVVVIDNEASPNNRFIADHHVRRCPYPLDYVHEPRRGIASARNAALDYAHSVRADFLAFIDDDEVAGQDWIAGLMAMEYRHVPVVYGHVVYEFPETLPFWAEPAAAKSAKQVMRPEGERMKTAATNNVRLSMAIYDAGFRFDVGLGLMGGEDNEFFAAVGRAGFEIRRTLKAITRETMHVERLGYWSQVYRSYWCAASDLRMYAVRKGWLYAFSRKAHSIPLHAVGGLMAIAASPIAGLVSWGARGDLFLFKKWAIGGGKKLAKAFGRLAALAGMLPKPYQNIVGE